LGKDKVFSHCIIIWRQSVKILTYLEIIHQGCPYEKLHNMVLSISKFWVTNFDFGANHEGQGWSVPRINQLSTRSFTILTPCLELIGWDLLKIGVLLTLWFEHRITMLFYLDHGMVTLMIWLSLIVNYANDIEKLGFVSKKNA
jgi:hypothetical protein